MRNEPLRPSNNHTRAHSFTPKIRIAARHPAFRRCSTRLPGNQVLNIHVQEKQIAIPRLAGSHDGLRVAHLTDLHMSGRSTQAFFEHVVEAVNETNPDLVAITGDIVEGDRFLHLVAADAWTATGDTTAFTMSSATTTAAPRKSASKRCSPNSGLVHVGHHWQEMFDQRHAPDHCRQ